MKRAAALLAIAVIAFTGCASDENTANEDHAEPGLVQGVQDGAGHVHGLGFQQNKLLIATHSGLWQHADGDKQAERIGESRRDVMGFTTLSDRLLGSGHPDPMDRRGEPVNVGVIESTDRGINWTPVALRGEVDFHALAGAGKSIFGYDAAAGRLMRSTDTGRTWQEVTGAGAVISLAVSPKQHTRALASTPQGVRLTSDSGRNWSTTDTTVGLVAFGPTSAWSVDGQGQVRRGDATGQHWLATGSVTGVPVAIAANGNGLVVALENGQIVQSSDNGATFTKRLTL